MYKELPFSYRRLDRLLLRPKWFVSFVRYTAAIYLRFCKGKELRQLTDATGTAVNASNRDRTLRLRMSIAGHAN